MSGNKHNSVSTTSARKDGTESKPGPNLPLELYREMRRIEPLLPDSLSLPALNEYKIPRELPRGKAYFRLADLITAPFSHLFVVSELQHDDADLVALNYINLVADRLGAQAPLVVLPLKSRSFAQNCIPAGVRVIAMADLTSGLSGHDIGYILTRLILQAKPTIVHNINSEACWNVFATYHRQIRTVSKLVASLLAHRYDSDGAPAGITAKFLNRCIDNLDLLLCNDQALINDLRNRHALEDECFKKLFVTCSPTSLPGSPETSAARSEQSWTDFAQAVETSGYWNS